MTVVTMTKSVVGPGFCVYVLRAITVCLSRLGQACNFKCHLIAFLNFFLKEGSEKWISLFIFFYRAFFKLYQTISRMYCCLYLRKYYIEKKNEKYYTPECRTALVDVIRVAVLLNDSYKKSAGRRECPKHREKKKTWSSKTDPLFK